MKAALGWVVAVLMLLLVIGGAKQNQDAEQFWKEREGRRAHQVRRLQADNAQLRIAAQKVSSDVRRDAGKTVVLRDSVLVHLTNTVLVKEFIQQTDTLRVTCLRCAATLDSLRIASSALEDTLVAQAKDAVGFAEAASRRQKRERVLTWTALVAGTLTGAWIRGQK